MSYTIVPPNYWSDLPFGKYCCKAIEKKLEPWFSKMYGLYLLKIGNLSSEIDSKNCSISYQINFSLTGKFRQVITEPLRLPFEEQSIDACLMAHILPWYYNPYQLLKEANRILIDDGWLILSGFNPLSLIGLYKKLMFILKNNSYYNIQMLTMIRQLGWLYLLNFDVLYYNHFHVLPWVQQERKILDTYLPALGCLQLIIARKRSIPLTFNITKQIEFSKLKPLISINRKIFL